MNSFVSQSHYFKKTKPVIVNVYNLCKTSKWNPSLISFDTALCSRVRHIHCYLPYLLIKTTPAFWNRLLMGFCGEFLPN
jgi:hypothetical protein